MAKAKKAKKAKKGVEIVIDLPPALATRVREIANAAGLPEEEFVRAAIVMDVLRARRACVK